MNNFIADMILFRITLEMKGGSNIVDQLHNKGYHDIFEVSNDLLKCVRRGYYYQVEEFIIDELHNLDDGCETLKGLCLFALRHRKHGHKGIFLGMLSDSSKMP